MVSSSRSPLGEGLVVSIKSHFTLFCVATVIPQNFPYFFSLLSYFWSMIHLHTHWHLSHSFTITCLNKHHWFKGLSIYDTKIWIKQGDLIMLCLDCYDTKMVVGSLFMDQVLWNPKSWTMVFGYYGLHHDIEI